MMFSVIVPTFNRPDPLQRCLAALDRLAYPKNEYEVIVVDDGGSIIFVTLSQLFSRQ